MDDFLDGGFDALSDEEVDGVDEDEEMDLAAVADAGGDEEEEDGKKPTAADAENETDGGEASCSVWRWLPHHSPPASLSYHSIQLHQRTRGTWQWRTNSSLPSPPSTSES